MKDCRATGKKKCVCCFATLFNKNVFLNTILYFPVIVDGQFSSYSITDLFSRM
jgi:hypothetical protein